MNEESRAKGIRDEPGHIVEVGDAGPGDEEEAAAERLARENERLRHEVEALRGDSTGGPPPQRHRVRGALTVILVILTSLSVVAATAAIWVKRTVRDTDRYVALVAPLAHDRAVTDALALRLTDDAFTALNVRQRVEDALGSIPQLPPSANSLIAGPLTSGVQNVIQTRAERFLASPAFESLWVQVNRQVHVKLVALLDGDYDQLPNVSVTGGEVRLNLVGAVARVLQEVVQQGADELGIDVTIPSIPPNLDASAGIERLNSALGTTLPPDFGQVTLMTRQQLEGYQEAAQRLNTLAGALFVLSIALLVATILAATDRRRAIIWLGLGITVAMVLAGIFLRRVEARITESIARPGPRAAARDVFTQVGASLRPAAILVIVVVLLAALAAYLLGRPSWLMRSIAWGRRVVASRPEGSELDVWVASHATLVRASAMVAAVVAIFFTGIDWIPVGIVGALLLLALWGVAVAERRVMAAHPASSG
jgi:hypothetical protein